MFNIAVVSQQDPRTRILFAKTDEWVRFIEYLKSQKKVSVARLIVTQIDESRQTNKVKLPRATANTVLQEAGVSF